MKDETKIMLAVAFVVSLFITCTTAYEIYEAYYECDLDYEHHPYEIEAEYEEEKWYKYKIKE